MRVSTLLVALAASSSSLVSAGPPAPGPDWFDSHRSALAAKLPPDAIAVIRPGASEGKRYPLFVKPRNWAEERWTGRRAGVEGAKDFRADSAYPIADFPKESRRILEGAKALYYADARDKDFREKLVSVCSRSRPPARGRSPRSTSRRSSGKCAS